MSTRAGGKIEGDNWLTRVRSLRDGDHIRAGSWGGSFWFGGEVLVVQGEPHASGLRDGFYLYRISPRDCPSEWRELAMRPDDQVTLAAREAPKEKPVREKAKKKAKQLSLFDDD